MKPTAFLFCSFLVMKSFGQSREVLSAEPTSAVIKFISKKWKEDSLGKNGFRNQVFKRLRYSKTDSVSKELLFETLGQPQHTSKFYNGNTDKNYFGYRYYILCENDFPKEKFFVGSFIEFVFDESETGFIEIEDGEYCF